MSPPPSRSPHGAGAPITLALLIGTGVGLAFRQPTIGFLGGLAVAVLIGVLLWRRDA
ncbi:hypothetical protein SAMN06297144_0469 [Sphingomonas guangdongensis]|uniref:Uncharacterized protein n=1 Tax=Sphingomonas guangdongensis TaxID=1141890 RepID=A0A285QBL5_9SPHN|nr:hypothetical protein [Sphingomonas guangdongensis]SOB79283.1 hypothetical protein SAMN06297144_0469 [Sphingomonas guangdongensis]